MKYIKATGKHAESIYNLVQETIKIIYPNYYPREIVDFFCWFHSREKINDDIKNGYVWILIDNEQLIGTGSFVENHITRVYVTPKLQRKGYGSLIMNNLENEIALNYEKLYLDSSLPARKLYQKRGYEIIKYEKYDVGEGVILDYEVMEKQLF